MMPPNRFVELLGHLLDDDITAAQIDELTQIVSGDPDALAQLRQHLLMSDKLSQYEDELRSDHRFMNAFRSRFQAAEDKGEFIARVVASAQEEASARSELAFLKSERIWKTPRGVASWAILAIVLLVMVSVLFQRNVERGTKLASAPAPDHGQEAPDDLGVAVLTRVSGVLEEQGPDWVAGETIPPGTLKWGAGILQLEFYGGATVVVEGPAEIEILDESRIVCRTGRLRAHVPEPASGFAVLAPSFELVDLGTEFGLNVSDGGADEVHVFNGKVELYDADSNRNLATRRELNAGDAMAVSHDGTIEFIEVRDMDFVTSAMLSQMTDGQENEQLQVWRRFRDSLQNDERVVAYFPFDHNELEDRILTGYGADGATIEGAIVGCEWTAGRWQGKKSLQFKRPGDRVRITVPGDFESLTYSIWLRVDGLDRKFNSLLLTDGFGRNGLHWQIRQNGSVMLGLKTSQDVQYSYSTDPVFNLFRLGQWVHLATVYDADQAFVKHYVNGIPTKHMPLKATEITLLKIGNATIGNWSNPILRHDDMRVRNLNGCMDELIVFGQALDDQEIRRIYKLGQP